MIGMREWNGLHVYGVGAKWAPAIADAEMEIMDGSTPRQKFWFPLIENLYEELEDVLKEDDMHTHNGDPVDER